MTNYDLVALGGTFDIIHKGHFELLKNAFSISSRVIIGLTSDELASKKGKKILHNYEKRFESLKALIEKNFPNVSYQISKLDNDFGPAVVEGNVQALVVSEDTESQGEVLNKLRAKKNLSQVDVIVVPMVLAKDGKKISTTRIKKSEIDEEGNLL
jgi:pantetheine-phosphate adenylyltransferase